MLQMGSKSARLIWIRNARNMPAINPCGPRMATLSNACSNPDSPRITGARKPAAETASAVPKLQASAFPEIDRSPLDVVPGGANDRGRTRGLLLDGFDAERGRQVGENRALDQAP